VATAFGADPLRWLPQGRREGPGRFLLVLHAGALTRTVRARVGQPWKAGPPSGGRSSGTRSVTPRSPRPSDRFLPSFDGELGLHVQRDGRITLILDGRYRPPGGALGAAADAALLHRVARGTTERFLEDVAARLAAEALLVADAASHERHVSARRRAPHEQRPPTVVA
jgi:hypothetical protein